jgi:hypothetical protein
LFAWQAATDSFPSVNVGNANSAKAMTANPHARVSLSGSGRREPEGGCLKKRKDALFIVANPISEALSAASLSPPVPITGDP